MRVPSLALGITLLTGVATAQERWRCTLELGDAELPFLVEIDDGSAVIINADERVAVPEVEWTDASLRLGFPHFDSEITATRGDGDTYSGVWRKQRRRESVAEVPFTASPDRGWRFEPVEGLAPGPAAVSGRWRVDFESESTPAVGRFESAGASTVSGTFLTRTGDYRFLEGTLDSAGLHLSCFDGAHAFLFDAVLDGDRLVGSFRSGNWWTESWVAVRDDQIALPDPYTELELRGTTRVSEAVALHPDGQETTLAALWAAARPKAVLVQVLGTWCPNCYDETELLKELHAKYADAGLMIVGLCFELTGDVERDLAQIDRYRETRDVPYPLLWAGEADKADTAEALGLTDRILSYPTTLFVNGLGDVDAVHSGFVGPAAVAEHAALRADFEERIERLLTGVDPTRHRSELRATRWRTATSSASSDGSRIPRLVIEAKGEGLVCRDDSLGFGVIERPLELHGELLTGHGSGWRVARGGYLQPLTDGPRLWPASVFEGTDLQVDHTALSATLESETDPERLLDALRLWVDLGRALGIPPDGDRLSALASHSDPAIRREAMCWLSDDALDRTQSVLVEALDSADPRQRDAAAMALGSAEPLPEAARTRLEQLAVDDPFRTVRRSARLALDAPR